MARLRAMLVSQVSGWLWAASKLLRRAPDVDVHLLQDVFGLGAVPVDTQHHGEQMRAGPLVERGKSRTIAESGAGQQAGQIEAALGPVGGGFDHGWAKPGGRPAWPSYNSAPGD